MADRLLPPDFRLSIDPAVRRPRPEVLIGGAPIRVLRLTPAGAALVDRWAGGDPVGSAPAARRLATRLLDAGMARARPGAGGPGPARVAVVVPVRDDPDGLARTLASLRATAAGTDVVVVDDGSRPPIGPRPGLVCHRHAGGPAAARNSGWRNGPGEAEVIVFVDAGCEMGPGWLPALVAHMADPGLAAVAPRVTSRATAGAPPGLVRYERAHSPLDLGPVGGPVGPGRPVAYVPTAVLAVRRAALAEVGGFDEALRFGEDVDPVWRLVGAGWRVAYDPSVRACHPVRPTRGRWLRQRFDYGRSAAPLAARHGRAATPLMVSRWSVAVWALAVAGRPGPALVLAAGSAAALARRAGSDRATAAELARLALTGHVRAGSQLARAVRRAWLPGVPPVATVLWRLGDRRARAATLAALAAVVVGDGISDWRRQRPPTDALRWSAWRLADDLAYQAGVWSGVLSGRSAGALLPRW